MSDALHQKLNKESTSGVPSLQNTSDPHLYSQYELFILHNINNKPCFCNKASLNYFKKSYDLLGNAATVIFIITLETTSFQFTLLQAHINSRVNYG